MKDNRIRKIVVYLYCFASFGSLLCSCKNKNEETVEEYKEVYISEMVNSNNPYYVVIPENSSQTEIYAAQEISNYYSKVTNQNLEVINDSSIVFSTSSHYISIGNTKIWKQAVKKHGEVDLSASALNIDGFVMFTYGESVFINAHKERGKLYGAYELIEHTFGVKFLNYRYTHIPQTNSISLYSYDKTYVPMFSQRAYLNTSVFNHDQVYTSHMRFNTDYCQLDDIYGGSTSWCSFNGDTSHTMRQIIPVSDYTVTGETDYEGNPLIKEEYREVFAHTGEGNNAESKWANKTIIDYCFTNGINDDGTYDSSKEISTVKMTIESLKKWILKYPECENFMIGQHDTRAGCPCEKCAKAAEKYTGGGRMVRFVNVIADEIKKWMEEEHMEREINFCLFAYLYTSTPPVDENNNPLDPTVIPRNNVYVKWAPIKTAFYYSPDDPRQPITSGGDNLAKWSKVTNRFHAWTYHCWYNNSLWYYPTTHAFKDLMSLLKKAGVVYEFAQGPYYEYNLYQSDLDAYVFSKLCWDFNRNIEDLVDEYNYYYFGEDAFKYVKEFHEEINDRYAFMAEQGEDMMAKDTLTKEIYWPYAVTNKLVNLFDKAIEATNENNELDENLKATYVENLERAMLSPMWMKLSMLDRYAGSEGEQASFAKRFVDLGNKYNLVKYGENPSASFASVKAKYGLE